MAVRGDSPGWQIVGWWERSPRVSCSAGSSGSKNGCQVLMVEEEEEAVVVVLLLLLLLLLLFWGSSCFAGVVFASVFVLFFVRGLLLFLLICRL